MSGQPISVAVNPSTDTIYVANNNNSNPGSNTVSVINGATNKVTATVSRGTNLMGWELTQTQTLFM